ncbi:AB hydrolase-1 domain-containing protein [Mycena chlorophos]|uniref:AB hydrolase-1 domain-containing protein n=1 Tax=Mycena chlorophos TaxID=658473 RepID=A0A8H6RXC6_MYCCL|nr:AB hydrolase-1 domain-containing protein [Mycena chlorophos]
MFVKECTSSDGTLIYADASGDPQNPSIVFVHGFAVSGIIYDKLFRDQRLLENFYLVRYDMRGYGRSGKPKDATSYSSALFAADFAVVVKEFGLTKPVFVGWSAGAPVIADICAHITPCPLAGAIGLSGAICPATADKTLHPLLVSFIKDFVSPDATTALNVRPAFIEALFSDPSSVPTEFKLALIGAGISCTPDIIAAILTGHQPGQCQDALTELGKQGFPVMALYGTEDVIQSGEVAVAESKKYFTDFTDAPIKGSGHTPFYEDVDATVDYILPFCLRVHGN